MDSIVADLKDICANPSAEDAGANFLNLPHILVPSLELYNKKVLNYMENVCGWNSTQTQYVNYDLKDIGHIDITTELFPIRTMLNVIHDIQENSKDWKCKYQIYCNMHFQPDI